MKKHIMIFLVIMAIVLSHSIKVSALGNETEPIIDIDKSVSELQAIIDKQFNTDLSNFPFYQNAMKGFSINFPDYNFGGNYFCYHTAKDAETSQHVNCFVFNDEDKGIIRLSYLNDSNKRFSFLPRNYTSVKPFSIFSIGPTGVSNKDWKSPGTSYSNSNASQYHLTSDNTYFFTNLDVIPIADTDIMQTFRTTDGTLFNANDVFLKKDENNKFVISSVSEEDSDFISFSTDFDEKVTSLFSLYTGLSSNLLDIDLSSSFLLLLFAVSLFLVVWRVFRK